MKASTICRQLLAFSISVSNWRNPPAACTASFPTSDVQSSLERPTFLTNLSTAGRREPGQNVESRIKLPTDCRATLP